MQSRVPQRHRPLTPPCVAKSLAARESCGAWPKNAQYKSWREKIPAEVGTGLDPTTTPFLGKLPCADYK